MNVNFNEKWNEEVKLLNVIFTKLWLFIIGIHISTIRIRKVDKRMLKKLQINTTSLKVYRQSSIFSLLTKSKPLVNTELTNANMSIFTILNQTVAILVTAFSKLIKVTNDSFIFYI